jgi:hypothetical protein
MIPMRIPSIFKKTDVTPAGLGVARSECSPSMK